MKESDDMEDQGAVFKVRELYDKYASLIYSTIKKVISDNTQAEDTLVDFFIDLHNNRYVLDLKPGRPISTLINQARLKAIERLCGMQKGFDHGSAFKTFSNGEKTVFALFHFRKFSIRQIVDQFHIRQEVVEKLLQSAELKVKAQQ